MYLPIFRQFRKTLAQVETWFGPAAEHAKARGFDPNAYLVFRLAPDQFAFARQVQLACDTAKAAAARLTGKEFPPLADAEATLEELGARVKSVVAILDGLTEADFADSATRMVTTPRWEGKTMTGHDYLLEHALPNFYFHAAHTYAILRHNGVNIGKKNYLGTLTMHAP